MEESQEKQFSKEEYNAEPVYYCSHCLSLKVIKVNDFIDCCDKCGSTDIQTTDIETWKSLYKEKYGEEF